MNIEDIKNILCEYEVLDNNALNEYLQLVETYKQADIDDTVYCERHHICPKSMYSQYKLSSWNIVKVPFDIHVEMHRLLCLIYQTGEMKRAYSFIARNSLDDKIKRITSGAFVGDKNPSKRPEVRKKISESKTGKKRDDLVGKTYFGANDETIKNGINKMKEKLKDTVIVRDDDGNRFRVNVNDPDYISGKYVSFNLGCTRENSASKRPEIVEKIMSSRESRKQMIANMSFDEIVELMINYHNKGKNIFSDSKYLFERNYSAMINLTEHSKQDIYITVVQRLSKV